MTCKLCPASHFASQFFLLPLGTCWSHAPKMLEFFDSFLKAAPIPKPVIVSLPLLFLEGTQIGPTLLRQAHQTMVTGLMIHHHREVACVEYNFLLKTISAAKQSTCRATRNFMASRPRDPHVFTCFDWRSTHILAAHLPCLSCIDCGLNFPVVLPSFSLVTYSLVLHSSCSFHLAMHTHNHCPIRPS